MNNILEWYKITIVATILAVVEMVFIVLAVLGGILLPILQLMDIA